MLFLRTTKPSTASGIWEPAAVSPSSTWARSPCKTERISPSTTSLCNSRWIRWSAPGPLHLPIRISTFWAPPAIRDLVELPEAREEEARKAKPEPAPAAEEFQATTVVLETREQRARRAAQAHAEVQDNQAWSPPFLSA